MQLLFQRIKQIRKIRKAGKIDKIHCLIVRFELNGKRVCSQFFKENLNVKTQIT